MIGFTPEQMESLEKVHLAASAHQSVLEMLARQACEIAKLDPHDPGYECEAIRDIVFNGVKPLDAVANLQQWRAKQVPEIVSL